MLRPRLERDLGPDVAAQIFVANSARSFAAPWPDQIPGLVSVL